MKSSTLEKALELNRAQIEAGLAEAEAELQRLRAREAELETLIARARAALGIGLRTPAAELRARSATPMTLHDALAVVLRERGNAWTTVKELADEVNRRGLYLKRDGSPIEPSQVHARTKNYASLFEKDGPKVRLIDSQQGGMS